MTSFSFLVACGKTINHALFDGGWGLTVKGDELT
jgi:hypothetical protein